RQLHKRLNLPSIEPYLEAWLAHSLEGPHIIERQGKDWFVEFRIEKKRMGYLVVTPLRDLIAVRTFLFLTMDRTPESRLLKKKLRLSRPEISWLGLHELSAFTKTDLKDDLELGGLFRECGCGQLFETGE